MRNRGFIGDAHFCRSFLGREPLTKPTKGLNFSGSEPWFAGARHFPLLGSGLWQGPPQPGILAFVRVSNLHFFVQIATPGDPAPARLRIHHDPACKSEMAQVRVRMRIFAQKGPESIGGGPPDLRRVQTASSHSPSKSAAGPRLLS